MKYLLFCVIWVFSRLPYRIAMRWGVGLGWLTGSVLRLRRRHVEQALARAFPEKTDGEIQRIALGVYRHLGLMVAEVLRLAGGRGDELFDRIRFEGEVDAARAYLENERRGGLILTAHEGNFELMAACTASRMWPVSIVAKDIRNLGVHHMWNTMRRRYNVDVITAHKALRPSLNALRANRLLGFMLDQHRPAQEGIWVDFFGRPASTTPALALMSARMKLPVFPVFIHRDPDGSHVIEVHAGLPPPPDADEETIRAYTQKYTRIIEDEVRRHPDQWMWLHRRWKGTPP